MWDRRLKSFPRGTAYENPWIIGPAHPSFEDFFLMSHHRPEGREFESTQREREGIGVCERVSERELFCQPELTFTYAGRVPFR